MGHVGPGPPGSVEPREPTHRGRKATATLVEPPDVQSCQSARLVLMRWTSNFSARNTRPPGQRPVRPEWIELTRGRFGPSLTDLEGSVAKDGRRAEADRHSSQDEASRFRIAVRRGCRA